MSKFLIVYHGGKKFKSPEESKNHMTKWRAWSEGLGKALVDPGVPVGMSKTISAEGVVDNGGSNPVNGITILQAENIDAAIELAKTCPHIDIGGTIEIAEAMDMSKM